MFQESLAITLLLPWLVAAGASGVLLHRSGKVLGKRLAELGIGVGFLAAYIALAGGLPWLDDLPNGEIGEAAGLSLPAAALLALWGPRPGIARWPIIGLLILMVLWLIGGRSFVFASSLDIVEAAIAALIGIVLVLRLQRLAEGGAGALVILAIMAAALAGIAWYGNAQFFAQLFLGFAAAILGLVVWTWPLSRWGVGAAALLIGAGMLLALVLEFWRNAITTPWALPVVLAALWSDRIALGMPGLSAFHKRKALRPFAVILSALVPAVVAVALAVLLARFHSVS
jgi:hypothetical protein